MQKQNQLEVPNIDQSLPRSAAMNDTIVCNFLQPSQKVVHKNVKFEQNYLSLESLIKIEDTELLDPIVNII